MLTVIFELTTAIALMKKMAFIIMVMLAASSLSAQTYLGIGTLIGGSKILPIANGRIGDFPVEFNTGLSTSIALTNIRCLGSDLWLKTDVNMSYLRSPGMSRSIDHHAIEGIGRIGIPVEIHFLKDGAIGGFFGIEGNINKSLNNAFIGFQVVPLSVSSSVGFSYFNQLRKLLVSLCYSIDVLAFAQTEPWSWVFKVRKPQHFHFGIIGIGVSYFPW